MAFPENTTLIDDFNRADGAVNAGGGSAIWTGSHLQGTATTLIVSSNLLAASSGGGCSTLLAFGPNVDFQFVVTTVPNAGGYFAFWWNINDPRTAGFDAYSLTYLATGTVWRVSKWVNGAATILGTPSSAIANGDSVGIRQRGGFIEFWKLSGGSWALVANLNADGTVPIVNGPIAFEFGDSIPRVDNLAGGTVLPAFIPRRMPLGV